MFNCYIYTFISYHQKACLPGLHQRDIFNCISIANASSNNNNIFK